MQSAAGTSLKELDVGGTEVRPEPVRCHFPIRAVAIRLFVICWLVYTLHFATNTVREIYLALSLGDHLSFDVSEYQDLHPFDIFEIPGRGAFINNNPGASILGAIPYTLSRPIIDRVVEGVKRTRASSSGPIREYNSIYPLAREFYQKTRARGLDIKLGLAASVMQAFLMAPLSALSVVVMFYILIPVTSSVRRASLLSLLYAFATPIFYRTAQLNQNLLVSHCAFFAFAMLRRPWGDSVDSKHPHYFCAGLLCGWAVVLDYSGIIVLLVFGLYALSRRSSLPPEARSCFDLLYFAIGVALCLAVLMGYQWVCFGSPFYSAQHYMPPTEFTYYGYRGIDWPHLDLLWKTAFGIHYGLFTSAPLLLLALYIPNWFQYNNRLLGKREMWCIILFFIAFLLFCSMNQYGRMQFNSGVRYIVPVTPFLFLLAVNVLMRIPVILAVLIGSITTYWSWCLAMYRDVEQGLGVFESPIHITLEGFRLPWLTTLERMGYLSGGTSPIALLVLVGAIIWIIWNIGIDGNGSVNFWRKFRETMQKAKIGKII